MTSSRRLPGYSNATVVAGESGKLVMTFPKGSGLVMCGKGIYRDQEELIEYLSTTFPMVSEDNGVRFSLKRKGKYQRIDDGGRPVFTFGDPLLDLVTDQHGVLTLRGERHDLAAVEISSSHLRGGGVRGIDLAPFGNAIYQSQVVNAVLGQGNFTLVHDGLVAWHSNADEGGPSQLWFHSDSVHMRFRAFRKTYPVYWKVGADIETWGGDFLWASIKSSYGRKIATGQCKKVHEDSDSDSTDDYVDEYESGLFGKPYDGVSSLCNALWPGDPIAGDAGVVRVGCPGGIVS